MNKNLPLSCVFVTRPTWIEISKSSIIYNISNLLNYINSKKVNKQNYIFVNNQNLLHNKIKICAIVKSNAYGHGLIQVATIISKIKDVEMLGITAIEEACLLRQLGVKKPILLLGSIYPFNNLKYILEYNITPTVASISVMKELDKICKRYGKKINFHLKVDTGMGRIGILPESIDKFIIEYKNLSNIFCEGVYTHFSSAAEDKKYTKYQVSLFTTVYKKLLSSGIRPKYVHTANSATTLLYPNCYFNMVRPGLVLYGMLPFDNADKIVNLQNVLSLKSKVVFIKVLSKGKYVSYSKTYVTKKKTKVATVCIGYADGIMRKLSNRGKVLIKGKLCNIIGRVTMDMIMIDVTDVNPPVEVGDEVVLIGEQNGNKITVEDVARWSETINYEVTSRLSERIPRFVV